MKFLAAAIIVAVMLGAGAYADSASSFCRAGAARGFFAIQPDPNYLVGTIPSTFTSDARYFSRRFNCLGRSAQVRRVDLGLYDVRFPGQDPRAVFATAISDEGVTASVLPLSDGIVRVALRGPLVGGDVMARRDVAFSVVFY